MAHSRYFRFAPAIIAACLLLTSSSQAGWLDKLRNLGKETGVVSGAAAGLTGEEIVSGLKEALEVGVDKAVAFLGRHGGYLDNAAVRIPMPESLQKAASVAEALGRPDLAEEFVTSMNLAAEQAAPSAIEIFMKSIKAMTFDDAKKILDGPDDAATRYLERTGREDLSGRFRPIVERATSEVGVTRRYKDLVGSLGPAATLAGDSALDLDGYVTGKALDGLFYMVAQEEKKIREDPAARTTEILEKVFGASGK